MTEDELRAELLALLRKQNVELLERNARDDLLTDEEWWERRLKGAFDMNYEHAEHMKARKQEMIAQRHEFRNYFDADSLEKAALRKAEKVLPYLIQVRREAGADGPLTEHEYFEAWTRSQGLTLPEMLAKIKAAAGRETEPRRRAILVQLATNVEDDMADMKVMLNPETATNESCEEFANKASERMRKLTDILKQPDP
jgi:hypothetical protein